MHANGLLTSDRRQLQHQVGEDVCNTLNHGPRMHLHHQAHVDARDKHAHGREGVDGERANALAGQHKARQL